MNNTPRTDAATVRMERLDGDIDEALHGDRFDDLVDRYRMKGEKP